MTAAAPLLVLETLSVGYGRAVLRDISLAVHPGEVVALSGPNGVGKSTLLRAFTGEARIFGGRVSWRPGLRIAYQSQYLPAGEEFPITGREVLALMGASPDSVPESMTELLDRRLDMLSAGQRQLLMVWAVLDGPADLVLLDEPTNNLDPAGIKTLAAAFAAWPPGRAALVVSHEAAFLRRIAGRIVTLER